ncbi:MAG: hypothetical protein IJ722_04015 [Alloprevotella sp.]|nr:hypothetical protein [Alloprevotella sp.]
MKRIYRNSISGGLIAAFLLLAGTACSDDHFDVVAGSASESNTLWQNIRDNGQTDSLALILRRTIVMKSQTDKTGKTAQGLYTYDQLLDASQSFTVWAPLDGLYNAKHYLDLLDERDALFSEDPQSQEAWDKNYEVANQFVLNHMARFNYESSPERQKVHLLNNKVAYYETSRLFNEVVVDGQSAPLHSANGALHFLSGISPFAYNIYDYIAAHDCFSQIWGIVSDPAIDRQEFFEGASTPGAMNEDGEVVYVDSVFANTNEILDLSGAQLRNEDSLYVALLPTDACWDAAYAKVEKLFNYGDKYRYDWDMKENGGTGGFLNTLNLDADSLKEFNTKASLIRGAYFTVSNFPTPAQADSASINHYAQTADSLISTNGIIYYNPNPGGINPNFGGQPPVKASNGYIYAVEQYDVDPAYTWITKTILDMRFEAYVAAVSSSEVTSLNKGGTGQGTLITLYEGGRNKEVKGELEYDQYRRFESDGATMTVDIMLPNVYSGKYKISAIMVPNRTNIDLIQYNDKDEEVEEHTTFACQVFDDAGTQIANRAQRDGVVVDPDTIQSYVLFESVEFTKCYAGLPAGYISFPRLRFTLSGNSRQNGNSKSLNIEKIILEPVRE